MQGYCLNRCIRTALGLIMGLVVFLEDAYGQSKIQQVEVSPGESVRLNVFSKGATSYVWLHDNEIIDQAGEPFYNVIEPGVYSAIAYNDYECASVQSNLIEVIYRITDIHHSVEHFCKLSNPTIIDIDIGLPDLIWFSDAEKQTSLSADTPLVDGVTYYALDIETKTNYSVQVVMDACLDIAVDKSVDAVEAAIGTQVNFTIVVRNKGNINGENLIIREQLPDGFTYEDHHLTSGHYSSVSGLWDIVELAPKATEILKLRARVSEGHNYENIAELIQSEPDDFTTDNNISSAVVVPNCIHVFEIISPNNDGKNDTFVIDCIEQYPDNILKVFNKDGSLVYSKKGYDNSWRGYSNANWTLDNGEPLPADVY